uniref:GGDEF domain-containing protein n=1 Tax=Castellaniella defragrans TaxID=75697 RepID=UPI00334285C7
MLDSRAVIPAVALFFVFVFAWFLNNRGRRRGLPFFLLSCLCVFWATAMQLLFVALGQDIRNLMTLVFYICGAWFLSCGLLFHFGKEKIPLLSYGVVLMATIAGVWYFLYVQPMQLLRIFITNFGCGLMLALVCLKINYGAIKSGVDRVIYWVYLAFAFSFFAASAFAMSFYFRFGFSFLDATDYWVHLHFSFFFFVVALSILLIISILTEDIEDLRLDRDRDALTMILNRRGFFGRSQLVMKQYGHSNAVCLLLVDLDNFKRVNDSYSHAVGDAVLAEVGRVIQATIRNTDIAGRIGGEEFAILLPHTDVDGGYELAERLRKSLMTIRLPDLPDGYIITASIGLAHRRFNDTLEVLLARADFLLYEAKRAGKNRVMLLRNI